MTSAELWQAKGMASAFRIMAEHALKTAAPNSSETYEAHRLNRAAATIENLIAHIEKEPRK